MSTLLYQALTLRREQSPTPAQEAEARKVAAAEGKPVDEDKKKPAEFVDVVTALIPAEIIVVNALILGALSTKSEDASGAVTTRLDPAHPGLEKWCWIGLVVAAAALYVLPHAYSSRKAGRRQIVDGLDIFRMLVPAAAFWIWSMIQKGTLFDAVFAGWSTHARAIAGGFGGLALIGIAKLLSFGADEAQPTTASEAEPRQEAERVPVHTAAAT
jgi:hypothetical protein